MIDSLPCWFCDILLANLFWQPLETVRFTLSWATAPRTSSSWRSSWVRQFTAVCRMQHLSQNSKAHPWYFPSKECINPSRSLQYHLSSSPPIKDYHLSHLIVSVFLLLIAACYMPWNHEIQSCSYDLSARKPVRPQYLGTEKPRGWQISHIAPVRSLSSLPPKNMCQIWTGTCAYLLGAYAFVFIMHIISFENARYLCVA